MSNIDKQALREVAEKATPGNWRRASSRFNGITVTPFSLCDEEVMLAHAVEKRDAEFIVAANPATMLALLDENLQLQREKDAIEAVALALRDDMQQAREQLEAAEKRNAEQREYYEGVIADGSKRIAELESKNSNLRTIAHERNELAIRVNMDSINDAVEMDRLHKRIAELEAREVTLPQRLQPGADGYDDWYVHSADDGEYLKADDVIAAIRAAGIKVKES
ncbi:ead/Ea22-like family protein [Salmonella enterica]|nr:ead/Ea22-like family protein [Salmonella enterica]EEF4029156.1 ead/Ea22-like family protein [Salmonella enterica]EEJ5985048.1 ead/Ea22-like family protein [Salmonella enterica]EEU3910853.1 ead/Ea22-like family protein [Salmonella enterica]EGY4498875.1 ead/Ea22-like family protein [Salmonella enterica]